MRRSSLALPVLLALLAAANPLEGDKFIEKADEKFEQAMARAQDAFGKSAKEAFETRLKTYRALLAAATKAGDFDRATALKRRIEEIEAERESKAPSAMVELDLLKTVPFSVIGQDVRWEKDYIFLHPPGRLRYQIPMGANRFSATGTLIERGQVKFHVYVDGVLAHSSESATRESPVKINANWKPGAKMLELVTDSDGPGEFDHAVWVQPKFER